MTWYSALIERVQGLKIQDTVFSRTLSIEGEEKSIKKSIYTFTVDSLCQKKYYDFEIECC